MDSVDTVENSWGSLPRASRPSPARGFRLYLLCSPDLLPVGFELAPDEVLERAVAPEAKAPSRPARSCSATKASPAPSSNTKSAIRPPSAPRPQNRTGPLRLPRRHPRATQSVVDRLKDQLFRAPRRLQPTRPQQPHRERLPVLTSVILHIHARTLGRRLAACDYSRNQSFSDLVEVNDEPAECNQDEYECYLPGDPRQHDGQGMPPWLADRILPR